MKNMMVLEFENGEFIFAKSIGSAETREGALGVLSTITTMLSGMKSTKTLVRPAVLWLKSLISLIRNWSY